LPPHPPRRRHRRHRPPSFLLCFFSCPLSCKCFFTPELSQLPDRKQSQTTVPPCLGFKAQRGSRSSVSTRFASFSVSIEDDDVSVISASFWATH
jgi:hypothetical protein